jgi:Family of unknown function (DUF6529)
LSTATRPPLPRVAVRHWLPMVAGTGVAVALGVFAHVHEPVRVLSVAGFVHLQAAKVWLTCVVAALAVLQVGLALALYGKLPSVPAWSWIGPAHRWTGRLALLLSLPVAVHCLYSIGLQGTAPRVLIHALCGCVFYGAFVAKMLLLSRPGGGGWALPVAGGLLFAAIAGVWLSSSLWFFTTVGG